MMYSSGRKGRRRLRRALVISIAAHVMVVAAIALLLNVPVKKPDVRRGEPLFVELQNPDERSPLGNPAMHEPGPPAPPIAARPAPKREVVPPAPPRSAPPKSTAAKSTPTPPTPKSPPAPEPTREPPRVASAPAEAKTPASDAAAKAEPAPRAPTPAQPPTETARPAPSESPRVASVPRDNGSVARPAPDLRALKGGGGGGRGGGRGGIEGEPIPLDSSDPKFNEYLDRLRRMIKAKWNYPCVRNPDTHACDYKEAELIVEFGILRDGKLQFVDIRRASGPGLELYDDYAVNAIKLASPFPPPPTSMIASMKSGSTGIAIAGHFVYRVEVSFGSLLR
jgi:outer membrane biosynthesis protein TonB